MTEIKILIFHLLVLLLIALGVWYVMPSKGDYIIEKMWLNTTDYCDNCLFIKFYEGCNRYSTYYFENQHEFDSRLEIGMPVDIKFKHTEGRSFVRGVYPRDAYNAKCS